MIEHITKEKDSVSDLKLVTILKLSSSILTSVKKSRKPGIINLDVMSFESWALTSFLTWIFLIIAKTLMCQGKLTSVLIVTGNSLMSYVISIVMAANLTGKWNGK